MCEYWKLKVEICMWNVWNLKINNENKKLKCLNVENWKLKCLNIENWNEMSK